MGAEAGPENGSESGAWLELAPENTQALELLLELVLDLAPAFDRFLELALALWLVLHLALGHGQEMARTSDLVLELV